MTHQSRPSPMPDRDPNNWRWLMEYMPYALVAGLTFAVAFVRGIHDGGPWKKSFLGALICTLLSIALYPALSSIADSQGWPSIVALAPCVFLGYMGTEWIRNKADDLYEVFIGRWRK